MLWPFKWKHLQKIRFVRRRILSFGNAICCPSVTFVKEEMPELLFKNNMTHIAMAFVFFAVCDICVALNYMHPNIIIGYNIWLLYGISQLLIINYAIPMRRYTKSFQYHYLKYL